MLYITTKSDKDAFTTYKALHNSVASDGGRYVPFRLPFYSTEDILMLKEKSFSQTVAEVLNLFFSCRLTGWDVDFCIGRNSVKLADAGNKTIVAELWHNLGTSYSYTLKKLYEEIAKTNEVPTDWFYIAVEIAVLFGTYAELLKSEQLTHVQSVDISLPAEDFYSPIAAWYARKMGLPIGTIICTCDDNSVIWDLINRGTFNTTVGDTLAGNIARLILGTLGFSSVENFYNKREKKQSFSIEEDMLPVFSNGFFCAVAGENRAESIINSVFRNNSYIIDPITARSYGGLQDYRAKKGCNTLTVLLSKESALSYPAEVAQAIGISHSKLTELMNHT